MRKCIINLFQNCKIPHNQKQIDHIKPFSLSAKKSPYRSGYGNKSENHENKTPVRDASSDTQSYIEFYEDLGQNYPESQIAHLENLDKIRDDTVLKYLKKFALKGKTLLDVGCNDGVYTIPYCKMGGRAHGIDLSKSLILKATEKSKKERVEATFETADILNYQSDKKYEVILFSEVLEHLNQQEKAIENIYKLLVCGGYLLLTTPTPLFEIEKRCTLKYIKKIFLKNKLKEEQVIDSGKTEITGYPVKRTLYRHDGFYPLGLKKFIKSFGFECIECYTIGIHIPKINKILRFLGYQKLSLEIEKITEKIPAVNLLGVTNVQLHIKK